jgi:hypothetical protein
MNGRSGFDDCCPIFEKEDVKISVGCVGSYAETRSIPTLPTQDPSVFTGRKLAPAPGGGVGRHRGVRPTSHSEGTSLANVEEGQAVLRRRPQPSSRILTAWKGKFSEDEMRRPTPHTQYPLGLQALCTGSYAQEGGSAHHGW